MKKLDYIDSLRGLAILGVILFHTCMFHGLNLSNSTLPATLDKIFHQGARGVQLFYIASAFTLFLSFKNRINKEKFPIKNFFIRRIFRIAPMYYIGICYYLFQHGFGYNYWLGDETHITAMNVISNVTFLHGVNPYWINSLVPGGWSITVEMMFYAILPFLFSKIKNLNQAFSFFLISLLIDFVLQIILLRYPLIGFERLWREYLFFYFPNQLPVFALGIMFYFIVAEKESLTTLSGKQLLVFGMILILHLLDIGNRFIIPDHILYGIGFLVIGIALSKYQWKLAVNPIINYIGKVSFSMYLVHFAVLHWLAEFNLIDHFSNGMVNYAITYSLAVAITVLISSITYNLIEIPFQKIGKKIIDRAELKHTQSVVIPEG